MRTAFLPLVLMLGGGVALGQNPATGAAKAPEQAQLRARAEAAVQASLEAKLQAGARAAEKAAERKLAQAQILEARNGMAPLTLPGQTGRAEASGAETSGLEPIPTQWPKAKVELIPTQWQAQVILVGGGPARPEKPPGKDAGGAVQPK